MYSPPSCFFEIKLTQFIFSHFFYGRVHFPSNFMRERIYRRKQPESSDRLYCYVRFCETSIACLCITSISESISFNLFWMFLKFNFLLLIHFFVRFFIISTKHFSFLMLSKSLSVSRSFQSLYPRSIAISSQLHACVASF